MQSKKKFREVYQVKVGPNAVGKVKKEFQRDRKKAYHIGFEDNAIQTLSIIGIELERNYPDIQFTLFGRKKSKRSSKNKIKRRIEELKQEIREAEGSQEVIEVKPLYDYYGFKCIFDNIPEEYIERFSRDDESISLLRAERGQTTELIEEMKVNADRIDEMTYGEFVQIARKCRERLAFLAYEESTGEVERNLQETDTLSRRVQVDETLNGEKIHREDVQTAQGILNRLITKLENKRDDKIFLAIGNKIIKRILEKSELLSSHGVTISQNPDRTKPKREKNGYVSDFFGLDILGNVPCELQLQSGYRYKYGEDGPAAHCKLGNGEKERKFIKRPKVQSKKSYKRFKKKTFKQVPSYFTYKGQGRVHIYDPIDNYRRYFYGENQDTVDEYVSYILEMEELYYSRTYTGYHEVRYDLNKTDSDEERE